jgi:hypothetical protein
MANAVAEGGVKVVPDVLVSGSSIDGLAAAVMRALDGKAAPPAAGDQPALPALTPER